MSQLPRPKRPLPKIAPRTIRRERLSRWLGDHADVPLRLVAGPAGSGKTTTLVAYLNRPVHTVGYTALEAGDTPASVRAKVAASFDLDDPGSWEALFASFGDTRIEVVLDDVERATGETAVELSRLVYEAPEHVTFLVASRARDVLDATRLQALGLAVVLDANRLAFTADEVARLSETLGVAHTDKDIARLLHDTDGWAFPLSAALRDAASARRSLADAFDHWRRSAARLLEDVVQQALAEEPELGPFARRYLDGEELNEAQLERLEARGLFTRYVDGAYRPYRAVTTGRRANARSGERPSVMPTFQVRLLGSFEARVGERRVAWYRRRDKHIFAFLALQPDGRATREQLLHVFWPGRNRQLALQSLRTAFSTMRRSLAAVVGYADVDHYVRFGEEIALNLDVMAVDVRRFRGYVVQGDQAEQRGDFEDAVAHYRAATRLAARPLLDDEPPSPWIDAHLRNLLALREHAAARLDELERVAGPPVVVPKRVASAGGTVVYPR